MKKLWIYVGLVLLGVLTMYGAAVMDNDAGLMTGGGFILGFGLLLITFDYFMDGEM